MNTTKTIASKESLPSPKISLDWKAYFISFCELHGGNPVEMEGRLLFSDGWTYSKTDYAGPEFPPPKETKRLNFMRLAYWGARLKIVTREYTTLKDLAKTLAELQRVRNGPIKHRVTFKSEDSGKIVSEVVDLDSDMFSARLAWLEEDVADCEEKIKVIEAEDTKQRS